MLLPLLLLLLACPIEAASFPGLNTIPAPPSSQATFESWLASVGRPVVSRYHGYKANYETYREYKMLVYGSSSQVPGNRYDSKTRQNSYLGYAYDELTVTNSLFPDDAPGGVTQSTPWQWKELALGQSARISWARLSDREKGFIKASVLTYRNNSYGGMTFSSLGLSEANTIVLAPPSWHLGFALYTRHYRPGSSWDIRYATFNGSGAGSVSLAGSVSVLNQAAADGTYVIGSESGKLDLTYVLNGRIASYQGLAQSQDVRYRGVGNASGWTQGNGSGPWEKRLVLSVSRGDLGSQVEKTFRLLGQVWAVSAMGDIVVLPLEKTITVRAEPVAPPFSCTADVIGSIHYFSGQTDSQGRTMLSQPHRFLALEQINISIELSREPSRLEYAFMGQTRQITVKSGQKCYQTSLVIPKSASTLSWENQRLAAPLQINIRAWDRSKPAQLIECRINDIDLTGSVYDISYIQVR